MKKSVLFGISLWVLAITLSSCGITGGLSLSNDNDGTVLSDAIERRDLTAIMSQNPTFMQVFNQYVDNEEKKKKVMAFAADMLGNMEKREPGSNFVLLNMVGSKDKKLVALAVETAISKFDSEVLAYAGTLEPGKVFQKIFNDY